MRRFVRLLLVVLLVVLAVQGVRIMLAANNTSLAAVAAQLRQVDLSRVRVDWSNLRFTQVDPTAAAAQSKVVLAPLAPADAQETPSPAEATSTATPPPTATTLPSPTPTPQPLVSRLKFKPDDKVTWIRPGVVHVQRATDDPLKINLLLFDMTAPEFDVGVGVGDGWLSGRTRTTYVAAQNGALAAVNGDLFSESGIPQGLTLIDGHVLTAPKHRATFGWTLDRKPFIGYFTDQWTWQAEVETANGKRAPLTLLNQPCVEDTICLYNEFAQSAPADYSDLKVLIGNDGRVDNMYWGETVRVVTGTRVLEGTGTQATWLANNVEIGDKVNIDIETDQPLGEFSQAISGGPVFVENGEFVEDCYCALRDCSLTTYEDTDRVCEDFSTDWKVRHYDWVRMPRTGVGFDKAKQTLIVAVVDGYQLGYSRGITQEEFADLFIEFGADTAMELDGGGSATMVLQDEIVNQPSDQTGERYVANALMFFWNQARAQPTATPIVR